MRLENDWNTGPIGAGLFVSGTFTLKWREIDPTAGRRAMVVGEPFTVGGGLPRTTRTRLEWTVSGVASLPAAVRIAGVVAAGGSERLFTFGLVLDDR